MLVFYPGIMRAMSDEHLISSLEQEPMTAIDLELLHRFKRSLDDKGVSLDDIEPHIAEALASYPPEDFLVDIGDMLFELSKNLKGDNRGVLLSILDKLTVLEDVVRNQSDYGRSELKEILKIERK